MSISPSNLDYQDGVSESSLEDLEHLTLNPPAYSSPDIVNRNTLRTEIDERIRALCEERNTLASVSRIPPELLTSIFIQARDLDFGRNECLPPVSHVCRAWRAASLNCALLWTHVECTRVSWSDEMALRSGTCPLKLSIGQDRRAEWTLQDERLNAYQAAFKLLNRATHFMTVNCEVPPDLHWPQSAPFLASFKMNTPKGEFTLPRHVYINIFTRLSSLGVENCGFDWKLGHHCQKLVHLEVITTYPSISGQPALKDIVCALRSMPHLEKIIYHTANEEEHGDIILSTAIDPVLLGRLRYLNLKLDGIGLAALLQCLPLPQEALLVDCNLTNSSSTQQICARLSDFYRSQSHKNKALFQTAALHYNAAGTFWQIIYFHPDSSWDSNTLVASFVLPDREDEPVLQPGLLNLCKTTFPFESIQTLMVTSISAFNFAKDHLTGCTTLCISDWYVREEEDFFDRWSFKSVKGQVYLPNLAKIIVHNLDLTGIWESSSSLTELSVVDSLEELRDVAEKIELYQISMRRPRRLDRLGYGVSHYDCWRAPPNKSLQELLPLLLKSKSLYAAS